MTDKKEEMTRFERVEAAVRGEPVDRIPFSFWYHFLDIPAAERAGRKLAEAEVNFYHTYEPDFLKVMHDIPFDLPAGRKEIESLEEWKRLEVIDPEEGNFGRQLEAIRLILAEVGGEVPVVDTVFNCFAYAERITGGRTMELLRRNAEEFHAGLSRLAESLSLWSEAIVQQGAAGIYLALQGATSEIMSEEEYCREFLPHDRQILERVQDSGRLNLLHLHGTNLHWNIWRNLPFQALSWSANLASPSLQEARRDYSGCIAGGVNEVEIGRYTPEQVKTEIRQAIEATEGRGLIAAPGCAVPTDCPPANLHAFKEAVSSN